MNRVKKMKLNSSPYIIKSDKFSTIEFVLFFEAKASDKYIFYLPLLRQLLLNSSKKYPTEQEYKKAYKENMIISQRMRTVRYNENLFFEFSLIVPDPKKVKDYNIEKAFKFFIDMIYEPNIVNGEFNLKQFEREREFLKDDIYNSIKKVNAKSYQSFLNIVDDKGIIKNNIYNNMNLIEEANSKELYEIYKENVLKNKPIIFVYGNVDESINDLIKKYIKIDDKKITFDKKYDNYLIPFNKIKDIEEVSEYNQSIIYVAYKIKDMKEEDKIYLNIVKNIMALGSNDLIFKKLRTEKNLVYSANTWCDTRVGLLTVEAYINNESKEEVIKGVKSVIKSLKDKEKLTIYLEKLIEDVYYELIRQKDSRSVAINDFINKKLEFSHTTDELIKKYKNINIDNLIDFINRLKLDTIYFLRGEFNENNWACIR